MAQKFGIFQKKNRSQITKVWQSIWFGNGDSRISITFFDQDTFGRFKKEQVIGWNQITGSKMQRCSARCFAFFGLLWLLGVSDHGNLRGPPLCHPGTINHWFPFFKALLGPYFLGGGPLRLPWSENSQPMLKFRGCWLPRISRKKVGWISCPPSMKRLEFLHVSTEKLEWSQVMLNPPPNSEFLLGDSNLPSICEGFSNLVKWDHL